MSVAFEGEQFGQRRPPLYHLITNILREYPSGQVFKEIIQNADDARATEVKFYLDCRNLSTLPCELVEPRVYNELDQFQGPALMSYNDAPFRKEDWESIQDLQRSGKAENPHKVGKFGIGFNSVYHITDLPVIISEDYCGYFEPQEHIWKGESGKGYFLKQLQSSCPQALLPYDGVSGFSKLSPSFNGQTLFRFPLRNKPSKLSHNVCTIDSVQQLLQALKAEAKYLLLFLRSVCSIEVIEISEFNHRKTSFKVSINSRDADKHKQQQQSLVRQVEETFTGSSPYSVQCVIEESTRFCVKVFDRGVTVYHDWLVVHRVGSEDEEVLALAEQQHVLPWVGTAFEISQSEISSGGRIFCFLPLPTEDRAPFNVSVNGTFAVSSNRRSLNWESQERQSDKEGLWNKYLVEKCIPHCYSQLVQEVMKISSVSPETVYRCWPVISQVRQTQWEGMLKPLFAKLLYSNSVVHTSVGSSSGQWISLSNAMFVPKGNDLPNCVNQVLVSLGTRVVILSPEQWSVVEKYYLQGLQTITPSYVKSLLKQNYIGYCNLSFSSKIEILQYCVSDQCYDDLKGLELIPLANGAFSKFTTNTSSVYVCTSSIRHDLLPGVDDKMVDLLGNDPNTHSILEKIARNGKTQLTLLNESEVAKLVLLSNPRMWSQSQLEKFWKWLQMYNLELFHGLDIVPVKNSNGAVSIHSLNKQSSLVFVSCYVSQVDLPYPLRTSLEKYGVQLTLESDFPYLNHFQLSSCVNQFEAGEVLDCIPSHNCTVNLTDDQALAMQSFLRRCSTSVQRISKICAMSLFSVIQHDNIRYSVNQIKIRDKALAQGDGFFFRTDLLPMQPLIFREGQPLLSKLTSQVSFINGVECLEKVAFVSIRNRSVSERCISEFMVSVLDNLQIFFQRYPEQRNFLIQNLSNLPFVNVTSGTLVAPSSLFNPRDELLVQLYQTESVFPSGVFVNYVDQLILCGLKGPSGVTAEIVNLTMCNISVQCSFGSTIVKCNETNFSRVQAFFKFLNKYPHILEASFGSQTLKEAIHQQAQSHAIFPIFSAKPVNYPACLRWMGSDHCNSLTKYDPNSVIILPNTINHSSTLDPLIAGSEVVFVENIPQSICILYLSHSANNSLKDCVVKHFKHVIDNKNEMNAKTLENIALQTYKYLSSVGFVNLRDRLDAWVWVESCLTFVKPEICALKASNSIRISLEPFVYVLSKGMSQYETLLCRNGVQKVVTNQQILSVLKNIQTNFSEVSPNEAWVLVKSILEWVVSTGYESDDLLVPVHSEEHSYPDLHPANEVSYTDNELLLEIAKSSGEDYKLVHPSVAHLASHLGLMPLSDQLDITEEVFQDAGQHEPLTTRLCNILKEYKDGLTIIKELIQNADDAEATEVNILYDARQHTTERLLFKGMANSHGPALVVHNNARFSEEDFANITKLAGATKKDKPLKIGKFGVGFCSVYHITDVPSFVSGDWLYIFDPTLVHLKGVVKNENQPGKRVKYSSSFVAHSQQLAPYKNMFGFNPLEMYDGTMFRFPFRKHASQISLNVYGKAMINELKKNFEENGKKMLLFLNHVKKVTFNVIQSGEMSPRELMVIEKQECDNNVVKIETKITSQFTSLTDHWLVSTESDDIYNIHERVYQPSVSSVACQLCETTGGQYEVVPVEGLVFCYLPLSVPSTGLPVHISANFAVMSNRSGIWTSTSSGTPLDSREWWNQQLMETTIPTAYCKLLKMLKHLQLQGKLMNYNFYTLFPLTIKLWILHPWRLMIECFYSKALKEEKLLFCRFLEEWLDLDQSQFLSQNILSLHVNVIPDYVLESLLIMKLPVIDIPQPYIEQFQTAVDNDLHILDQEIFCQTFMSMIMNFSDHVDIRNNVLYNMFLTAAKDITTHKKSKLTAILKNNQCVPCSPSGVKLKVVSTLVDPMSELKELFDIDSEMFPIKSFSNNRSVHQLMVDLGLLASYLPWEVVLKCAESIHAVYNQDKNKALKKVQILLYYIEENVKQEKKPTEKEPKHSISEDLIAQLKEVEFIPVVSKPDDYILPWRGSGITLSSPSKMFYPHPSLSGYFLKQYSIKKECFLLGTQKIITNSLPLNNGGCGTIHHSVVVALGFQNMPEFDDVISNYKCLLEHCKIENELVGNQLENIEYTSRITCEFVENVLKRKQERRKTKPKSSPSKAETSLHAFRNKPFIWMGSHFISPENVALQWRINGPFLYQLPSMLSERKLLIDALCIVERFSIGKLLNTLEVMYNELGKGKLDEKYFKIVNAIVNELNIYKPDDFKDVDKDSVILPSASYKLLSSKKLSFNDSQWLPVNDDCILVHQTLTREVALALGVTPVRSQFLDKYSTGNAKFGGTEFGQRVDLTLRIKNILRDYPLDATLLKELLQNADDAKATKMCVILDKRKHGTERIPSKDWSDLQGPALLVWNNEEFTEKDLEGIQKLGLGSKRDDSESIGQFGIGFNVVYHLTDCPSLITGGKTFCVFDPHCRYAPGANPINPGRRYDDLEDTFWNVMSDLKKAYFQCSPIANQPSGIDKGSLFRFPLRSTKVHIMESEIVDDKVAAIPLSAEYLENELDKWVLQIKDALIFLNHITEFSYYVINSSNKFQLKTQFKVTMDSTAMRYRKDLFKALGEFKLLKTPCIFNYQIEMECTQSDKAAITTVSLLSAKSKVRTYHEQWFIQQGIGDMSKSVSSQKWQFIDKVLPKHGIATPINADHFKGKIFCFLPLPGESGLPVHINGQFILSSTRRLIWAGDPESVDEKEEWNDSLFEAIASSYVQFLIDARDVFVKDEKYTDKKAFFESINRYYSLYPFNTQVVEKNCSKMAKLVFHKIWASNSEILASEVHSKIDTVDMTESKGKTEGQDKNVTSTVKIEWNALIDKRNPFKQVFFEPRVENSEAQIEEKKQIISLLKCIKLKLTCAPHIVYEHFVKEKFNPVIATPKTVFKFYCSFYQQIFADGCPCSIEKSPFKTAITFYKFINYLLPTNTLLSERTFPKSPFGYPLLLTADNMLRCFDADSKTICSLLSRLFPNSSSMFLHKLFVLERLSSRYFITSIDYSIVDQLLQENYSSELRHEQLDNREQHLETDKLKQLWECLVSEHDPLLKQHQQQILKSWALTPAKNNCLYSTRSKVLPIIPFLSLPGSDVEAKAYKIFLQLGLPVIDLDCLPDLARDIVGKYFPTMKDYDRILTVMYNLHLNQRVFSNLSPTSNDAVRRILKYFSRSSFLHDKTLKNQIKQLPLFKSISGTLTSLSDKRVYLWPLSGFCDAGYSKWASPQSVVFLGYQGDWRQLTNDFTVIGTSLDEKDIYLQLILPNFSILSSVERQKHLEYIRDSIYPSVKSSSEYKRRDKKLCRQRTLAREFMECLKSVKCIEHPKTNELLSVCNFSDHTVPIFCSFSDNFIFLPKDYHDEEWLEFFHELGLRVKVTVEEYIKFCSDIENGMHKEAKEASQVLLEYLFDKGREWQEYHLRQVANICFVVVADLPHLSWIKAPCSPLRMIKNGGVGLTRLNQSVLFESAPLIWTVRPVFIAPDLGIFEERNTLLKNLGITPPSSEDVIQNIKVLSKSSLANFALFTTYPPEYTCTADTNKYNLIDIICKSFEYLQDQKCPMELFLQLKNCPCIPVSASSIESDTKPTQVVLVKPVEVVKVLESTQKILKPYINELPSCLSTYHSILETIGVKDTLELIHVQHILETVHSRFENGRTNNPNEIKIIYHTLVKLNQLMNKESYSKKDAAKQLTPLLLPFASGKCWSLKLSKDLMFVDSTRYRSRDPKNFDLVHCQYSLFQIPPNTISRPIKEQQSHSKFSVYEGQSFDGFLFNEKKLSLSLPDEVRPQALSLCVQEKKLDVGSRLTNSNNIILAFLTISKTLIEEFKEILPHMWQFHMEAGLPIPEQFVENFVSFVKNMNIEVIDGLRASVFLEGECIGTLTSPLFVLEKGDDCQYTLYIDNKETEEHQFWGELSRSLLIEMANLAKTNGTAYLRMIDPIKSFFQAHNILALKTLGEKYDVKLTLAGTSEEESDDSDSFDPKLGKRVPKEFINQNDDNINSIFRPQEWVAYEISEECFIWAFVLYTLPVSDDKSELPKYLIVIGEGEDSEKEVSIVVLYKIVSSAGANEIEEEQGDQKIVPIDGDSATALVRQTKDSHEIIDLKRSVCNDLRRIWKLTNEDEKKKAIKELYLEYHPDKANCLIKKAEYEEVSEFLKRQVEQLERDLPLEDPEKDNGESTWSCQLN